MGACFVSQNGSARVFHEVGLSGNNSYSYFIGWVQYLEHSEYSNVSY